MSARAPVNRAALLAGAALTAGVLGCANYSQLQDAETLPKGQQTIGVGLSFTRYSEDVDDDGTTDSVSVPAVVLSARRGITDRLEGQATAWLPLGARAGAKLQLFGTPGMAGPQLSIGAHLGYLQLSASSDDSEATASFLDVYAPIYLGYRLTPGFEIYAAPQYMFRSVFGEGEGGYGHVLGGTGGLAIGERSKIFLEAGSFYDTLVESAIFNTAIGVGL